MHDRTRPEVAADHAFTIPHVTAAQALASGHQLIDVRKAVAVAQSGLRVAGARWHDPFALGHHHPLMASTAPLVVFCAHGHEVSHFATALLMLHGVRAWAVVGGFQALVAAGAPTVPDTDPSVAP